MIDSRKSRIFRTAISICDEFYAMASKRRMSNYFITFFKLKFNESMLIHLVEVTHDRKCLPEKWYQTQCEHQNRSNSEESDDDEVTSQFYRYIWYVNNICFDRECMLCTVTHDQYQFSLLLSKQIDHNFNWQFDRKDDHIAIA